MKTKYWIVLLAGVLALCLGLSVWLLWPDDSAAAVEVWSDGELLTTLSLSKDRTLEVRSEKGVNVVTVKDGKVAVTEADCPDHYCMDRGFCSGGAQIVCLPNALILKFTRDLGMDGVAG